MAREDIDQRERVERIVQYFEVNKQFGESKSFQRQYVDASDERKIEVIRRYEIQQLGRCLQ